MISLDAQFGNNLLTLVSTRPGRMKGYELKYPGCISTAFPFLGPRFHFQLRGSSVTPFFLFLRPQYTTMVPSPPVVIRTRLQEVALGMILLGVIFSSLLYGIVLTQTYKYYQRFKGDPRSVKVLVFAVLLLNTASLFFASHAAWYYLVTTGPIFVSIWSLNVELALSMVVSALSETFLSIQVYRLSGKNRWLTAILLTFAFIHFSSGEVAAIKLLLLKKSARITSEKVPSILRLTSAAVCDTAIASALSYYLHAKRTGFKRNDEIINYLILFSINSGLLTSATSIASLITYVTAPRIWVYTALCFMMSRLYATTFLCSLNSRQILLNDKVKVDSEKSAIMKIRAPFSTRRSKWSTRIKRTSADAYPAMGVLVVTETISDSQTPLPSTPAKVHISDSQEEEEGEDLGSTSTLTRSFP
ncbi:hypothetical protein CPB84DRAFT_1779870 [Gymnopilus junonius]|uniref:DUF6534 domain-containing protein n=1 Tax=Gymnopilus junonius TaxID=109634 RepID=A0A9P5TNE1_GYMJU|nr:hypothetical protein CPB84DRAFT_1779870 [Gymnopilus junonius]